MDNTQNLGFSVQFSQLKIEQAKELRELIRTQMGWCVPTFYNKKSGRTALKKPEIALLRDIFLKHGITF